MLAWLAMICENTLLHVLRSDVHFLKFSGTLPELSGELPELVRLIQGQMNIQVNHLNLNLDLIRSGKSPELVQVICPTCFRETACTVLCNSTH